MIRFVCPCGLDYRDLLEFEEHCAHTHGQEWLLKYTEAQRQQRIMADAGPQGRFAASMVGVVKQAELRGL